MEYVNGRVADLGAPGGARELGLVCGSVVAMVRFLSWVIWGGPRQCNAVSHTTSPIVERRDGFRPSGAWENLVAHDVTNQASSVTVIDATASD